MHRWALVVVAACGGGGSHPGDARVADVAIDAPPGRFLAAVAFATAANPTSIALVDVDGDGKLDLVAADTNVATVSILANTTAAGAMTPSFAAKQDVMTGMSPACVVAADFNGDGTPDLATANVAANTASVLLDTSTTGAISFASHVDVAIGNSPEYLVAGDLDGDGKPDLATADFGSNQVSILRNTTPANATTASFVNVATFATGTGPVAIAIGDLDHDGKPDLATANLDADTVSVLTNSTTAPGTPVFSPLADLPAGAMPGSLALRDLDGDGRVDLVIADSGAPQLSIVMNATSGFSAPTAVALPVPPSFVATGDLDGDGKPDLVATEFSANTVSVLLAANGFATHEDFPVGVRPRAVAIGDLNGDGKPDLAVANGEANAIYVLLAR